MEFKSVAASLLETINTKKSKKGLYYKNSENSWEPMTYGEFGLMITATANSLSDYGTGYDDKVCIFSQNMPEWSVVDFALQFLRAVSVPVYPTASVSQALYIVKETEARIIFVGQEEQFGKALQLLPQAGCIEKIVVFDEKVDLKNEPHSIYFKDFISQRKVNPDHETIAKSVSGILPDDILTIIYTSGTTGEPKGVMLSHECFVEMIRIHNVRLTMKEDDISLAFLPLSHIFERGWTNFILSQGYVNYFLLNIKEIINELKVVKPTLMCAVPRFFEKSYAGVFATVDNFSSVKKKIFYWAVRVGTSFSEKNRMEEKVHFFLKFKYLLADKLVLKTGREVLGGRIRFMPCAGASLQENINRFFHAVGVDVKYGYGLTETSATVSCFTDTGFIYGSVGKVMPDVEVKTGDNDEILVRGKTVLKGYYKKPADTAEVLENGWFKTGDSGKVESDGTLYMFERIKDIIKTSSGKFVAPQMLESLLGDDIYMNQVTVTGNEKNFITALIVPAFEQLEEYANMNGIPFKNRNELVNHPEITRFYQSRIDKKQQYLANYEQIKKFRLLASNFSIDSGELTSTLKMKRKFIEEKYRDLIDEMYK